MSPRRSSPRSTHYRPKTIVITGASTGIGRATALAFARRRDHIVLAARTEEKLDDAARECERLGGRALVVPTDVTDEAQVQRLAHEAIEAFGKIDVWINNAGVGLLGRFDEVPINEHRRVFETNFFGYLYGAWAALRVFKRQGYGVIINNASISSIIPLPRVAAYVASKQAIRGLSMSLRQDLLVDGYENIHVCTLMPTTIDTPAFQHAANLTGYEPKIRGPIIEPEKVARVIVKLSEKPEREVFVGHLGRLSAFAFTLAPGLLERFIAYGTYRSFLNRRKPVEPHTGNLYDPVRDRTRISGGWKKGA